MSRARRCAKPAAVSRSHCTVATTAAFDASVPAGGSAWNIDSPANKPPIAIPYSPPASSRPRHTSTECAQPSSWRRRYAAAMSPSSASVYATCGKPFALSHAFSRCRFCVVCSTSARGCSGTSGAIASSGPQIRAGKLRGLAITSRERSPLAPELPTVAESGLPGYEAVLHYGIDAFARDLAAAGGLGMITPDLIPDEADQWLIAAEQHNLDRIFLVAPSSTPERLARTVDSCRGFVYAASTMGVTGTRDAVSTAAPDLVHRVREVSDIPIGVGLGVRSREQAAEIAHFANGVIVGSALVSALSGGVPAVRALTGELAAGVREKVPAP